MLDFCVVMGFVFVASYVLLVSDFGES